MYTTYRYKSASQINTAMASVYKHMSIAVLISMLTSYLVSNNATLMNLFFGTELKWIIMFAPLVAGLALGFTIHKLSKPVATLLLYGFAVIMGLSMATIFAVYTSMSIFTAFMGAAILFATMSFYGYFTKQNLDSIGKWLLIGLIAIVIASIVNIFIGSTVAQTVISAVTILIFLGLTAYDTQRIRDEIALNDSAEVAGALSLYLNFINIFINLLQLFGNKE